MKTKKCEWCKEEFNRPSNIAHKQWAGRRFCSKKCGLYSRKGESRPDKMGENHPGWKGGKIKRKKGGYILLCRPKHPYCQSHGYFLEHRLVMEKHLGRYLHPKEVVQHLNGNKQDNGIENLELIKNQSEHMKHHFKQDPITGKLIA